MTDIYDAPKSDLENIDPMETPRTVYVCCALFAIEAICNLILNFTDSFGLEALKLQSIEGIMAFGLTAVLLVYFCFLVLNRRRNITQWVYILLAISLGFHLYQFAETGFTISLGSTTAILSGVALIFAAWLLNKPVMKKWLVL